MAATRNNRSKTQPNRNPYYTNLVYNAAFTIAVEGGNAINVNVAMKTELNVAIDEPTNCRFYLASDSAGLNYATAVSGGVAAGASGAVKTTVTGICGEFITETNGVVDLVLSESGAGTWYLVIILPDGSLLISNAITFV